MSEIMTNGKEFYERKLADINSVISALSSLAAGKDMSEACRESGIRASSLRAYLRLEMCSGNIKEEFQPAPDWRENFVHQVYGEDAHVLPDFDEAMEWAKLELTAQECELLDDKYRIGYSVGEMAEKHDMKPRIVTMILSRIKTKLRQRVCADLFLYGAEYTEQQREVTYANARKNELVEELKTELGKIKHQVSELEEARQILLSVTGSNAAELLYGENMPSKEYMVKMEMARMAGIRDIADGKYPEVSISKRTLHALMRCGICNVAELSMKSRQEIEKVRGVGNGVMKELDAVLQHFGLVFSQKK